MFKAITSVILSIFTVLASLANGNIKVTAPADTTDFTPVIRFIVESDNHIKASGDIPCLRINKSLKLSYAIAEADKEYNSLDAVLFVGDIANNGLKSQYYGFKSTIDACVKDETQVLALLALRSHDGNTLGAETLDYFSDLTDGLGGDKHTVINGFHFITISHSENEDEKFGEYQREWLKAQLDEAVKDDPTKPIFVAHHEHILNTVFGSSDFDGWGCDYFRDILNQYPQVVHFSGHSHYPVNDPRSIWQGEFTAIGTGSMKYVELTVDDDRTIHPLGHSLEAAFWMVEVDANNRIRLRAYDLTEQQVLCEYILENPLDRSYTPEKQASRSTAPVFKNANVKVKKFFGSYKITVDCAEATDDMPIILYRAYVLNENNEVIDSAYCIPKYYSATPDKTETISLGRQTDEAAYVKIVAETAYGVQSKPIIISL